MFQYLQYLKYLEIRLLTFSPFCLQTVWEPMAPYTQKLLLRQSISKTLTMLSLQEMEALIILLCYILQKENKIPLKRSLKFR